MNLQPILTPPKSAPDISVCTAAQAPDEFLIYYGLALVERVNRSTDDFYIKLLAARLYNLKFKVASLTSCFQCAHTTLRRWGAALLSGDPDRIKVAFLGQGPPRKVTPAIDRYVRRRFRALYGDRRDYSRQIASEVSELFGCKLSAERLRWIFKEERHQQDISMNKQPDDKESDDADDFGANCCDVGQKLSSILPPSPNYSLWSANFSGLPIAPGQSVFCHHAGLILVGRHVEAYLRPWQDSSSQPLLRQFCAQLLSGAVNHEQSKLLHSRSLEMIIGGVVRTIRYQRERCDDLATPATIRQLQQCNLRYVKCGINENTLYYDPHTKEYTGQLKILKGWCGSRHAVRKILIMDFIHRLDGTPLWVRHFDNYDDVRDRFFCCREAFLECSGRLEKSGITWIFDRGLFSLETLQTIRALGDHFVTWEKGYKKDGWCSDRETQCFFRYRYRNSRPDVFTYGFEYQESQWARDPSIRQLIVRAKGTVLRRKSIEVSILCSSLELDRCDAIWYMFNRWVQENDLGYLIRHSGIGELTSRAYETYFLAAASLEDRDVQSQESIKLKRQREKHKVQLGRLLVKRHRSKRVTTALKNLKKEKEQLDAERDKIEVALSELQNVGVEKVSQSALERLVQWMGKLKKKFQRYEKKQSQSEQAEKCSLAITELTTQLNEIDAKLAKIPAKESRLKALQDAGYVRLDTARKALMDNLRIGMRNIFYEASLSFRLRYDNLRDDHDLFRTLLHSPGIITHKGHEVEVCLLPHMDIPRKLRNIIDAFLHQLTTELNQSSAGGVPPITIRLPENEAEVSPNVTLFL